MSLLSQLTPNALTQHELSIEDNDDGIPNTFVPARNLLFLSFAGAVAYQIHAKHIITGVCEMSSMSLKSSRFKTLSWT